MIGYTTGVFDLFHIGHLNILKQARSMCDKLIVGVSTDELILEYKNKVPTIPFAERAEIVSAIKYVDLVVPQTHMDKFSAWKDFQFNTIFVGDDWKGTEKWNNFEKEFSKVGVEIIYFPYTKTTSSTLLNKFLSKAVGSISK